MKRQVATFLIAFFWQTCLTGAILEINASYDYFRGLSEGSWNGNQGALLGVNGEANLGERLRVQLGGSYGFYNWDGRGNTVFGNSKKIQGVGFVTAGCSGSFCQYNAGIAYDRLFSHRFGIYNLSPSFDQLRFQTGYAFRCEEFGIWGTTYLSTSHKHALGLPIHFRAISQINMFWTHHFENCAKTTVWAGVPYRDGLISRHRLPGKAILGFSVRVPLTDRLLVDGYGSYMWARQAHGVRQSRNYAANLCLGLTYAFFNEGSCESPFMAIANHSNFLVDTNVNQ